MRIVERQSLDAPFIAFHSKFGASEVFFRKDQEIFGESEPADCIYEVVRGAVRSYKGLTDGRRQICAFHLPGNIFGLENSTSHRFTAEAIVETKPASSTETHWKSTVTAFASGASMRLRAPQLCRGEDSDQYRCGAQAANDLDAFIAKRPVNCNRLDRYGRTVATCTVGDVDLGEWLVRNGLALDWPEYSKGRYDAAQRDAERAGRGMWKGSYVEPWLYRVCIRAGGRPSGCSDDANAHP